VVSFCLNLGELTQEHYFCIMQGKYMFGLTDRRLSLAHHQGPKQIVVTSMHKQCLLAAAAADNSCIPRTVIT